MAFDRDIVEGKISAIAVPILDHMIKILMFDDPINYEKHVDDINKWILKKVQHPIISGGKRPKPKDYYAWLFGETITSLEDLDRWVDIGLKKYHKLPRLRKSSEVYNILRQVYTNLSKDLSINKFKNIKNYL